jgi:photosystem II stability/assembly factor-like uncharacterized protein
VNVLCGEGVDRKVHRERSSRNNLLTAIPLVTSPLKLEHRPDVLVTVFIVDLIGRQSVLRLLLLFLLFADSRAQTAPQLQDSHTRESLRGVCAVSRHTAWASGTHGTYLRTLDGGQTWTPAQIPGARTLDFRAVVAFSSDEAFLMSAGPGDQSRIYHTNDAGLDWQLQFKNDNPKGFFDSMAFWDSKHGIVLGDPVADETGKVKFELLLTEDGQTWHAMASRQLPSALEGEGAFAASNSSIATLPSANDGNIWFATGGKAARVFHSADRGQTWSVVDTPIVHGPDSAGVFSIAFRDPLNGIVVGGDYKHPNDDVANVAFTTDGGKTWNPQRIAGARGYLSAVAYVNPQRWLLVGSDSVIDSRENRRRQYRNQKFNAISTFEAGAFLVGPQGAIAAVP